MDIFRPRGGTPGAGSQCLLVFLKVEFAPEAASHAPSLEYRECACDGGDFAERAFGPVACAAPGGAHRRVLRCHFGGIRLSPWEVSRLASLSAFNSRLTICESTASRAPVAGSPFVLVAARFLAQNAAPGWRLTLVAFVQSAGRFDLKAESLDGPRAFSRLALRAGPCTTVRQRARDVFGSKGPFVPHLFVAPGLFPRATRYSVKMNAKSNWPRTEVHSAFCRAALFWVVFPGTRPLSRRKAPINAGPSSYSGSVWVCFSLNSLKRSGQ